MNFNANIIFQNLITISQNRIFKSKFTENFKKFNFNKF